MCHGSNETSNTAHTGCRQITTKKKVRLFQAAEHRRSASTIRRLHSMMSGRPQTHHGEGERKPKEKQPVQSKRDILANPITPPTGEQTNTCRFKLGCVESSRRGPVDSAQSSGIQVQRSLATDRGGVARHYLTRETGHCISHAPTKTRCG